MLFKDKKSNNRNGVFFPKKMVFCQLFFTLVSRHTVVNVVDIVL